MNETDVEAVTYKSQIEKLFDVACTLTDVMSCVPFEQYTFEYGPRDYLNQLISLISTLRGGQQRYLPLLISKINETMPAMPTPGYGLPIAPASTRVEELYESQSSAPNSGESTPFGSPPLSAVGPQTYGGFGEMDIGRSPTSAGFPMMSMTSSAPYIEMTGLTSTPGLYQDPATQGYSGSTRLPKWESIG